jgi:hypothetical protein
MNTQVFMELLGTPGEQPRVLTVLSAGKELSFQVDPGYIVGLLYKDRIPPQSFVATVQVGKKP